MSESRGFPRALLAALVVAAAALSAPAGAHPLGNFTISHYAAIGVRPGAVDLDYGLDLAEIPTFQEMERLDANHDGAVSEPERRAYLAAMAPTWRSGLELAIDGRPATLALRDSRLELLPGAGGLSTMRIWLMYSAPLPGGGRHALAYADRNFDGRPGWKEIVATASGNARLLASDAPSLDRSRRLTKYPTDLMADPPRALAATVRFVAPAAAGRDAADPRRSETRAAVVHAPAPRSATHTAPASAPRRGDAFTRLIHIPALTPGVIALALLIAFGLGAAHALSPGHGKTIVGAYLVGSRGTAGQAVFLGAVVTISHTIGVFALGLVTLFASRYILPERLYPWLGFGSGIMVAAIGAGLFHERIERLLGRTGEHRHLFWKHSHELPSAAPAECCEPLRGRSLLALGVSGGIVPCPSALVVLLASIALHRTGFGLLLIVAFSLGLALVLTGIGLLFVYAGKFLERFRSGGLWMRLLPVGSAAVVTALGLAIAIQSLTVAGLLRLRLS